MNTALNMSDLELEPGTRIKALWQVDGSIMWWGATVQGPAQSGSADICRITYDAYGEYTEQTVNVTLHIGRMLRDCATGDENVWRYDGEAEDAGLALWEAGLNVGDRIQVAWKSDDAAEEESDQAWWYATIVGENPEEGTVEVIYDAQDDYEEERSLISILPAGMMKDLSSGEEGEWRMPQQPSSDDTPPSDATDESVDVSNVAVTEQLLAVEAEPFSVEPHTIEQLCIKPGAKIKVRWIALDDDVGAAVTYKWCPATLVGPAPENGELWDPSEGTLYSIRYDPDPEGEYDMPEDPLPVLFTSPCTLMQDLGQEPTSLNNLQWHREGYTSSSGAEPLTRPGGMPVELCM